MYAGVRDESTAVPNPIRQITRVLLYPICATQAQNLIQRGNHPADPIHYYTYLSFDLFNSPLEVELIVGLIMQLHESFGD